MPKQIQNVNRIPAREFARWILDNVRDENTTMAFTPTMKSPLIFDVRKASWVGKGYHVMLEDIPESMSKEHRNWLEQLNKVPYPS